MTGAPDRYEVYALKYAERNARTRADSFMFDGDHASPHPMDYFIWVIRNQVRTILVDTGYDAEEAVRRGRPTLVDPAAKLADLGLQPSDISDVIITHLHYDHAGGLRHYEHADFHLQQSELSYAVSPCMCHDALRAPFTGEHICSAVRQLYSGKLRFHDGPSEVAPGVRVHHVGGHSKGLQMVEVDTDRGPVILASDASHYYENFERDKLFPIVVDPPAMLSGFATLRKLSTEGRIIVPGHDPKVLKRFAAEGTLNGVVRLDRQL